LQRLEIIYMQRQIAQNEEMAEREEAQKAAHQHGF
jgi:hypothetical protein